MPKFYSTKTYNTDTGLSCCFRQWRSTHSHCSKLHGYSIGIKLTFETTTLDERNWVQDFGGLKRFKEWAEYMFDHTMIVAEDDPLIDVFRALPADAVDLRIVPAVGCERFAEMASSKMSDILDAAVQYGTSLNPSVRVKSVEVFEHGANSAIYEG